MPPRASTDLKVAHFQQVGSLGLCCMQEGDKHLVVATHCSYTLSAWNAKTDELEWSVDGVLPGMNVIEPFGVVSDGRGHLFVCDVGNACVQMFSADGKSMGAVLRAGKQGLGKPWLITWCDKMSSLVVAHICQDSGAYQISVIKTYL